MAIQHILNKAAGESGLSSRAKLNAVIDIINDYAVQIVYDTYATFAANNLILPERWITVETDTITTNPKYKISDGVTAWNDLPYAGIQSLLQLLTIYGGDTGGIPFTSPDGMSILTVADGAINLQAPSFNIEGDFNVSPWSAVFPNTNMQFNTSFWQVRFAQAIISMSNADVSLTAANSIFLASPITYCNGKILFTSNQGIDTIAIPGTKILNVGVTNADVINYGKASSIHNLIGGLINIVCGAGSAGLVGSNDYSANYLPYSFVQKVYLDALQNGLKWKFSCRASTTTVLPSYTPTGTTILTATVNGVLPAQDGVTLVLGDRLLVKNESAGNRIYNGGYLVTSLGSVSTPWILTRVSDANTSAGLEAATWTVREGTVEGGRTYSVNVTPIVIGTTQITFALTQGPGTFLNGTYLSLSSNVFDINFASFTTDVLNEGSVKLFFTNARAIAAVLTAYAKAAGTVASTDSILQAIQKLDGNDDLKADKLITHVTQTASYTLALTDKDKMVEMDVATANNLTIPLNATVAFPIGSQILWRQEGAGQTTIVATGGVTIKSINNQLKSAGQYAGGSLIKRGTNEWELYGATTL